MPFNSQLTRSDVDALIPPDISREIIQGAATTSATLALMRRLPNMSRQQRRMPVLNSLLTAYFVTGDTGLKQTTEMDWVNKYIDAEELAVIVPIPEAVLDDTDYDIWGEIKPRIVEALGRAIDAAVLYGTNKPSGWPTAIVTAAIAAGNRVVLGTNTDLYDDILSEGGSLATVEADGYMVNGHVAAMIMKARLRGLRDANGQPIFLRSMQDTTRYELDGAPMLFPMNGAVDPAQSLIISGDWNQAVFAMRQDITYKLLTEAVITDNSNPPAIIYNLAQQDMVALRCVVRLGWQVPNPITAFAPVEANRYPFAALTP